MNHDLNESSQCYGLFDDEKSVGFIAVIHFPHPKNKKIKRIHRLVILPDYQGIGLGTRFLDIVAEEYNKQGFDVSITTSAKNMIFGLRNNKNWKFVRYGHTSEQGKTGNAGFKRTLSNKRNTASFIRERGRK